MLVSDPHHQQASLRAVYSHLSDNLVKSLTKELLSDRANALGSSLTMLQCFLQFLLQCKHIISWWLGMTHILHEEFTALILPVSRHYHVIQHVLGTRISIHLLGRMFGFLVFINILWDLNFCFVVDQRKGHLVCIMGFKGGHSVFKL